MQNPVHTNRTIPNRQLTEEKTIIDLIDLIEERKQPSTKDLDLEIKELSRMFCNRILDAKIDQLTNELVSIRMSTSLKRMKSPSQPALALSIKQSLRDIIKDFIVTPYIYNLASMPTNGISPMSTQVDLEKIFSQANSQQQITNALQKYYEALRNKVAPTAKSKSS